MSYGRQSQIPVESLSRDAAAARLSEIAAMLGLGEEYELGRGESFGARRPTG